MANWRAGWRFRPFWPRLEPIRLAGDGGGGRLGGMTFPTIAPFDAELRLATAEDTATLAQAIAPLLMAGDVILLHGPIGAGKTHFARALVQARLAAVGRAEDVPSPTFTLVQVYEAGEVEVWHADLYRLTHADEVVELGLDEAFEAAICLVEWADRLGTLRPAGALDLTLAPDAAGQLRRAHFHSDGAHWAQVFAALRDFGPGHG